MNSLTDVRRFIPVTSLSREINTVILVSIIFTLTVMWTDVSLSAKQMDKIEFFLSTYVGIAWPFFVGAGLFIVWVFGAWVVEIFLLTPKRPWSFIVKMLDWASEACPYVGLLTTFFTFLKALMVYAEAGPGSPDTQAAFIGQFAIAFGSSITGGILALMAFTLRALITSGEK